MVVWREVVEEFESGSLQAFQAAMTGKGTWEGRIKQISKIKGFVGVKFPETAKIRQERNEGRKVEGSSVLMLTVTGCTRAQRCLSLACGLT